MYIDELQFSTGQISVLIDQASTSISSGAPMTIQAQGATGLLGNGGELILSGGSSALATPGNVVMYYNGNPVLTTSGTASFPSPDNTLSSGEDGYRWSNLYTYNINSTGSLALNVTTVTASSYSVDSGPTPDCQILVNYSGSVTITLPSPTFGRYLTIKDSSGAAGTYNITINQYMVDTIDGSSDYTLSVNYESINLICDGTNWFIV